MKGKKNLIEKSLVNYQALANDYSHFEIAFLASQKAIELIRSAAYLNLPDSQDTTKKPKVAVVALKSLCDDPDYARAYKDIVMQHMFEEEEEEDSYNIDNDVNGLTDEDE